MQVGIHSMIIRVEGIRVRSKRCTLQGWDELLDPVLRVRVTVNSNPNPNYSWPVWRAWTAERLIIALSVSLPRIFTSAICTLRHTSELASTSLSCATISMPLTQVDRIFPPLGPCWRPSRSCVGEQRTGLKPRPPHRGSSSVLSQPSLQSSPHQRETAGASRRQ